MIVREATEAGAREVSAAVSFGVALEHGDMDPDPYLLALRQVLDVAHLRRQSEARDARGPAA